MKNTGRLGILAALFGSLTLGTALAQSTQNQQNQSQNQQKQSQNQSDQGTGVSHPPPDSTIVATEPMPTPAPGAKPSPAVPATASNPASSNSAPATQPAQTTGAQPENPDDGIVTSVPPANTGASANGNEGNGNDNDSSNPDYGIVTSVPPANAPSTNPGAWNPNDAILNYVPVDPNALGEGTNIAVRLSQDLSSASTQQGATFSAVVAQDVYNGSRLVIPAGSEMRGVVVHVSQGRHLVSRATLMLRPDVIVLPDGTMYHLYAAAVESKAPGTRVNDEGAIVASHHYTKDAVEYGAGAGAGAAAGAAIGGPVGAGVGAVAGAGVVSTHMLMQPTQAAILPRGSILIFSLTEPMPLTPTKN